MIDRPAKPSPLATLVVWASRRLTLGEKVIWYRDWSLDRGDADGCYAGAKGLSESLGGSVTAASVATIRKRLKRLGLHEHARRPDGRNPGWYVTLPAQAARPRSAKEALEFARLLDVAIAKIEDGPSLATEAPPLPGPSNGDDLVLARAPAGGVGGAPFSTLVENRLPSAVGDLQTEKEKGVGSTEPMEKRGKPGRLTDMVTDQLRELERKRREA